MEINKNKKNTIRNIFIVIFVFSIFVYSFSGNTNNKNIKSNLLEGNVLKSEYESKLIVKDDEIKNIQEETSKKIEEINNEKKKILSDYTTDKTAALTEDFEKIFNLQSKSSEYQGQIDKINFNTCGVLSQKDSNKFDEDKKCTPKEYLEIMIKNKQIINDAISDEDEKDDKIEKQEKDGKIKLGYTEDGQKIKFNLTRYFTPEYDQVHFKNTFGKNGYVVYGGELKPTNEQERWKYFLADGVMQCGTTFYNMPKTQEEKNKIIHSVEQSCLYPGINPFYDVNGNKKDFYGKDDALKTVACDYEYIAKLADLGCNPKIYNSTPKSEWEERKECRKKLNKELTLKIQGLGDVKCTDAGGKINMAHLDIWMGIGNQAIKGLRNDSVGEIQMSTYNYNIDGTKTDTPKQGLYSEIEIYKNGVKVY